MSDEPDLIRQMSMETVSCYWCGAEAQGTAADADGGIYYTCGAEGHGTS